MTTTTLQDDAKRIAGLFNNSKEWKINTILPLFTEHPDAKPSDVLGYFTKDSAIGFVYAAYYHAKSDISISLLSPAFIGKNYAQIAVKDNETDMISELLRVKSRAVTSTPDRTQVLKSLKSDLKALRRCDGEYSDEDTLLIMAIREELNNLPVSAPALV
jgi:hypothetical protein